ncbi:hypothetical protein ACROYT_G042014 [Oculina patagonica]
MPWCSSFEGNTYQFAGVIMRFYSNLGIVNRLTLDISRDEKQSSNCHFKFAKRTFETFYEMSFVPRPSQKTFHYDSGYWRNKSAYNLAGGETGFDSQETKLPTYWNTSFSKICLGMKIGQQINFIVINKQANSLYSLIADGQYRPTSLGLKTWKRLIGLKASLQTDCIKEGFNAIGTSTSHSKARIGILGNEQKHCDSCDSRIGFGTGGSPDDSNTCGNEAAWGPDNGSKHIKAMGYILVH